MYYIGIDVGGMSIKGGLTDGDGKLLYTDTVVTAGAYTEEHTISEDIHKLTVKLIEGAGIDEKDLKGIGIGQAGSIDSERGIIRYWNNIPMENVHVREEMAKYHKAPVFIDNDANVAALGEYRFGSGKGYDNLIFVTLGTGVGSGIIIDGKIFRGVEGAGAEAGHMVIMAGGERCNCGRRGCWEAYASASALIRQTKAAIAAHPESAMVRIAEEAGEVNGITAFKAAKAGDEVAKAVVDKYIDYVGEGLVSLANIFRPRAFLIGGGISKEGEYLTAPLQHKLDTENFGSKFNPEVVVKPAILRNDAGILGAVALAMQGTDN